MIKKIVICAALMVFAITSASAQTGSWSGKLNIQGTQLSLVFHLDDDNPSVDSPDQGAKGIPARIERPGGGKIIIDIPSIAARYEGQWLIKQIVGTFSQMNLSLPLTLTPGEDKPERPQTPKAPFPYATEEVSFSNGDIMLNGTLTLPEGYSRETPALIMVTGSGQQNRDEEIFDHRPFAVIADAFARAGIATLRYDDRGYGSSAGNIYDCTVEDFKADALAGMELLRKRFDKVGVAGHSEGGTIALMIAADQKADFIISLAGMTVSGAETLVWQNRKVFSEAGLPDAAVEAYCRLLSKAFEARVKGSRMPEADSEELPDALKKNYMAVLSQMQLPYMTHFLSMDMRPVLGKIACPVLALNGTKDIQVDSEANLHALRDGLPDNKRNVIEAIEGVNHLFQHCGTGSPDEYRTIEETISPEVLEKMTSWLSYFK